MGESYVQVAPDSTGKKLRTYEKVVGANTVQEQYVIQAGFPTFYFQSANNNLIGSATNHHWDVFNAVGSGIILKVRKLFLQQLFAVQASPTVATFEVRRTSTVVTGGTAITGVRADTADPAMPAQVTSRSNGTGGGTDAGLLCSIPMSGEETDIGGRAAMFYNILAEGNETKDVTLREGEGLRATKTVGAVGTGGQWSVLGVITVV